MLRSEHSVFLGQQIGNFAVKELLRERTASNLYLAQDIDADRPVFLEILHPFINNDSSLALEFRRRMERVAQLEHPSIAAVYEVGIAPANVIYAAIEYVPGVSLAQKLAGAEAFTVVQALALARQIADALATAHAAGIIHHDLRPENIIVSGDNKPVLIDLGVPVVANVPGAPIANGRTVTLDYTPPEHFRGKKLTAPSNVYSLGIILYELLAGQRPQLTRSRWDIFDNAMPPREIALEDAREGLHPETGQLVRECLRRQEWGCYESMEQMLAAIDRAIAAEQSGAPRPVAAAPFRSRRLRWAAAAAMVLLALLLLWGRGRSNAEVNAGQPTASVPNQGSRAVLAGALAQPTATATATLSPTPLATPTSVPEAPVEPLAPAGGSEFSSGEDITFDWTYMAPLATAQRFVIYLRAGDDEAARLGPVNEPASDSEYRLVVDGDTLGVAAGVYEWQVVLEDAASGAQLAASSLRTITLLAPTPTSSPAPTATATLAPTPSATPCVISRWPTWVRYTIQRGDRLYPLALERGTLVEEIMRVNCLEDDVLTIGRVLWLPPLPAAGTPTP